MTCSLPRRNRGANDVQHGQTMSDMDIKLPSFVRLRMFGDGSTAQTVIVVDTLVVLLLSKGEPAHSELP